MSRFKSYLIKSLNKPDNDDEGVAFTQICLEIINEYPTITEVNDDVENEIKITSNYLVKLFAILTHLVLKLYYSVKRNDTEEIIDINNEIVEVEEHIDVFTK